MKAAYVVDTPILLDILENDPEYGASSAALLDRYSDASLHISLISYFELAPAFDGKRSSPTRTCERRGRSSTAHGRATIDA